MESFISLLWLNLKCLFLIVSLGLPYLWALSLSSLCLSKYCPICLFFVAICVWVLTCFSHIQLFATLWTQARQTPLSIGFCRKEDWSGVPFPTPGDLPNPRIEPASLVSSALTDRFFTTSTTWEGM